MSTLIHLTAAASMAVMAATPSAAQQSPGCQDMQIALYFPAYETEMNAYSERVVEEASQQLRRCVVTGVSVHVLSEEAHTDEDSAMLSEARADSVLQSIMNHGIDASTFEADFTRLEAAAASAKPMVEPMARRVSVSFAVSPQAGV